MCLVALAIGRHPRYPLVVASNRDEYFGRPTAPLGWWSPQPGVPAILGGRDLQSGGTWLGLSACGRLALVTNVRGGATPSDHAPTRGRIVPDWLDAPPTAHPRSTDDFWARTLQAGHNGFNLIAADFPRDECFWAGGPASAGAAPVRLERGVYGLSNAWLDAPWPKVERLKSRIDAIVGAAPAVDMLAARLFAALTDRSLAADSALPRTGIPLEWERRLSAAFIGTPDRSYGTRCSTLVITERIGRQRRTHVIERTFDGAGQATRLRHAVLRDWPPSRRAADRCAADAGHAAVVDLEPDAPGTPRISPAGPVAS